MDWAAAKSYFIGYHSIDRFGSIVFVHNYYFTWSIALISSLILPLLFIFAPSSLHTTRTSHFLIVCIVCLSNVCCSYVQVYIFSGIGEPNLSFHTCRFIIYISTFAKPIGICLTLLFSIERLFTKILSTFLIHKLNHRQLFKRLYTLCIFIGITLILSFRLYEVLKLLPRNQSALKPSSDNDTDSLESVTDTSSNSTDRNVAFQYCFKSINIDTYAKILSLYVIQYWLEYFALTISFLILLIIIIHQCCLPLIQKRSSSRVSVNTKLYLSLSSCVISSELILLFFHLIVDDINNNNTNTQLISLQLMLFAFNFRSLLLPLIVCITTCDPLKQLIYELLITRPYLDNINENDNIDTMNNQPEPFSSPQRTSGGGIQQKFRRGFTKNNKSDHDYFDNDESQADL